MATINFTGTGGIIEGNLGTADVNVNLDAALDFDGSDDYVKIAGNADLDFGTGDFTIAGWIKGWDTNGTAMYLFDMRESGNTEEPAIYFSNPNVVYYANATAAIEATLVCSADDWNHIALSRISGTTKLYINGVEKGSVSDGTDYDSSGNTIGVNLGRRFSGSNFLNGNIADFRIYKGEGLSEANIQVLASKINGSSALGAGTTNLKIWLKINEGTGTAIDNAQGGTDGVAVGSPAWVFDQYYVDVQDNNTGGSGNFKVTQGKVEGLSLTSPDLNGSSGYVATDNPSNLGMNSDTKGTWSAWIRSDENDSDESKIISFGDANANSFIYLGITNGLLIAKQKIAGTMKWALDTDATFDDLDKWVHVALVQDGTEPVIYVNGVAPAQAFSTSTDKTTWITDDSGLDKGRIGCYNQNSAGNTYFFDGDVKDVKLFNYALSADQMASLYSGTYPQTPLHWYKLDEGTGGAGTSVIDSGTGTQRNGEITGTFTWINGTLDLDNVTALTTQTNGIFSAPRGTCQVAGDITGGGKIIHNNGTFESDRASSTVNFNFSGTGVDADGNAQPMFYDVLCTSATTKIVRDTSIARELHIDSAATFKFNCNSRAVTLTMGTTSSAGEIHQDGGSFHFENNTSNAAKIVAADTSGLNPWFNVAGYNIDWDSGGSGSNLELANGNYNDTVTTGGGGVTITLTGDMEFDAVTVSSGDTLDCTDQRVVFSGLLTVTGTIDVDGALIFVHDVAHEGTLQGYSTAAAVYTGAETYSIGGSWDIYTNMLNIGAGNTASWGSYLASNADWTIGSGKLQTTNYITHKNMTIAAGGELDGQNDTLTFSGDWTSSGGLLGTSAVEFNGSDESAANASATTWGFGSSFSIEFWFKTSFNGSSCVLDLAPSSGNNDRIQVLQTASEMAFKLWNSTGTSYQIGTTAFTINPDDGKWHHLAFTSDGSTQKIYYDGRLAGEASHTITRAADPTLKLTIGMHSTLGSHYSGFMDELRIFSNARAVDKIRTDMFQGSTLADETGLVARYKFDEGTGTAIDNENAGTDVAARDLIASGDGVWAGAGTFTQGTSTVDLTGTGTLTFQGDIDFNILKCAAATKTTTIKRLSSGYININTNLYKGAGTLSRDGSLSWRWSWKTGTGAVNNSGLSVSGASYPVDLSDTYVVYYHDATLAKEVYWDYYINATNVTFAANQKARGYWMNAAYQTDAGDYNLECDYMRFSDSASGKFIMGAGDLWFKSAANGLELTYPSNTFAVGPGATVSGSSAGTNFKSQNDFVIVGNVENLDVTNEELKVTGLVTNCTGDIHQYFPTIDHDQQIDADTADDRDIQLHGDKLDRDTELINS